MVAFSEHMQKHKEAEEEKKRVSRSSAVVGIKADSRKTRSRVTEHCRKPRRRPRKYMKSLLKPLPATMSRDLLRLDLLLGANNPLFVGAQLCQDRDLTKVRKKDGLPFADARGRALH
jgi:hypothetical protein